MSTTDPKDQASESARTRHTGREPELSGSEVGNEITDDRGGWSHPATVAGLVIWGAIVLGVSVPLAGGGVALWWLVPLLGAAMPLVLAFQRNLALRAREPGSARKDKEGELLGMLYERGEPTTPAMAAVLTSLSVEEAGRMLEKLSGKGHLTVHSREGVLAYELPAAPGTEPGDKDPAEAPAEGLPSRPKDQDGAARPASKPLSEPLSDREVEVLRLMATGKTHREVARDLFVAVGTVKNHSHNIYRKLEARNRAEALNRARELSLL